MNRVLTAARLNLVHPLVILGMPWLIVASASRINLAIWASRRRGAQDGGFTGGSSRSTSRRWWSYVQAVTQLLPFAMGLSLAGARSIWGRRSSPSCSPRRTASRSRR